MSGEGGDCDNQIEGLLESPGSTWGDDWGFTLTSAQKYQLRVDLHIKGTGDKQELIEDIFQEQKAVSYV